MTERKAHTPKISHWLKGVFNGKLKLSFAWDTDYRICCIW